MKWGIILIKSGISVIKAKNMSPDAKIQNFLELEVCSFLRIWWWNLIIASFYCHISVLEEFLITTIYSGHVLALNGANSILFAAHIFKKNSDEDNFRSHMGDNVDNSTDSDIIKFLLPRPPSIPSKGNRGIENQQQFCFCQPNDWQLIEHYPFNAGISLILFLADFSSPIPSPTVSGWIWHYLAIYWHFLAIL